MYDNMSLLVPSYNLRKADQLEYKNVAVCNVTLRIAAHTSAAHMVARLRSVSSGSEFARSLWMSFSVVVSSW